jgi:hypothetical protein
VLDIDGDEIVTPELAAEIRALFANGEPEFPVYQLELATAAGRQTVDELQSRRIAQASTTSA